MSQDQTVCLEVGQPVCKLDILSHWLSWQNMRACNLVMGFLAMNLCEVWRNIRQYVSRLNSMSQSETTWLSWHLTKKTKQLEQADIYFGFFTLVNLHSLHTRLVGQLQQCWRGSPGQCGPPNSLLFWRQIHLAVIAQLSYVCPIRASLCTNPPSGQGRQWLPHLHQSPCNNPHYINWMWRSYWPLKN